MKCPACERETKGEICQECGFPIKLPEKREELISFINDCLRNHALERDEKKKSAACVKTALYMRELVEDELYELDERDLLHLVGHFYSITGKLPRWEKIKLEILSEYLTKCRKDILRFENSNQQITDFDINFNVQTNGKLNKKGSLNVKHKNEFCGIGNFDSVLPDDYNEVERRESSRFDSFPYKTILAIVFLTAFAIFCFLLPFLN